MTSLLKHTVAQPTKWRFLPKNLKSPKFDFQSQFSMSKVSFIILIFVSVKIIRLGKQLRIKPFFDNLIFELVHFLKLGPIFVNSQPGERKSNPKNN